MTTHKQKLIYFRVAGLSHGHGSRAVFRATVVPALGPAKSHDDAAKKAIGLISAWRTRVDELAKAGWKWLAVKPPVGIEDAASVGSARRKWAALNCEPAAFFAKPSSWFCDQSAICPHCWGRRVYSTWKAVDSRLFPTAITDSEEKEEPNPAISGQVLIVRTRVFRVNFGGMLSRVLNMLHERKQDPKDKRFQIPTTREDRRKLMALGVTGGLEFTRIEIF
jgi:hypothetical protein